ncbi:MULTISPECIES: DUF5666 domain-containing protein [unclassified Nocardioides]|uniref:DUF5666 domain-containing protein n=1 Tax=unclassified Nocardioides TaxID=2615069 RepID=UPI0007039DC9|nr:MULTISPECIES: DUF5666 domain-containing protein [unclassified Nocardioides]KRC57761.1 hypothetical protein ASE19_23690 [Nocardioides sp. Root79]KRC74964.1 hypothetical protein ASE20_23650 [Nocardioides sp. Root240]
MSLPYLTRAARPVGTITCSLALAALLVGCGSDDTTTAGDEASAASGAPSGAPAGGPGGGGAMPGAFGEIAAIDGKVLQVRSQLTGQVAVTWTDDTTITSQAAAKLADVTAGVCVVVRTADTGTDAGSDTEAPTEVTAASVALSTSGDDGCSAGLGGGPGGGGPGGNGERPTDLPSDFPTDLPSGAPGGGRGGFGGFGTIGTVASVSATGFVVEGRDGDVTVTVGADTTYSKQVAADATALTVGRCVQAQGDADDTGAVTASTIRVSDKVDDQCGR